MLRMQTTAAMPMCSVLVCRDSIQFMTGILKLAAQQILEPGRQINFPPNYPIHPKQEGPHNIPWKAHAHDITGTFASADETHMVKNGGQF
jgi:hypothetical protein